MARSHSVPTRQVALGELLRELAGASSCLGLGLNSMFVDATRHFPLDTVLRYTTSTIAIGREKELSMPFDSFPAAPSRAAKVTNGRWPRLYRATGREYAGWFNACRGHGTRQYDTKPPVAVEYEAKR